MDEKKKEPEIIEAEVMPVSLAEIEKFDRGTVDVQITTAKQYPRNIKRSLDEALSMATIDEDVAASCMYAVPRKNDEGKPINITGKSVGLAKICANAWGNMRIASDVIGESEDRRFIIARGFAWDLEKNVALAQTLRRRITNRRGVRYSEDMIQTTGMAAGSIGLRNCVLGVLPITFTDKVYDAAKTLAVGNAQSLQSKKENALKWLAKYGVSKERLLARLERLSMDEITVADMESVIGFITSLKDGMDPEDLFPLLETAEPKDATLAEKVAAKAAEAQKGGPGETARDVQEMPRNPAGAIGGPSPSRGEPITPEQLDQILPPPKKEKGEAKPNSPEDLGFKKRREPGEEG